MRSRISKVPPVAPGARAGFGSRGTPALVVALGLAMVLGLGLTIGPRAADAPAGEQPRAMFGGDVHRNAVNTVDKNVPTTWSVKPGAQRNVRWSTKLGNKSYGGPVVAGGKVFVGTNNEAPRDPAVKGPRGIVM